MTVKEAHEQAVADQQILDESKSNEPADIHQKLYEVATKNWTTVGETQISAQGGSENFQEGPGGWQSGTGYGQFFVRDNFTNCNKPECLNYSLPGYVIL
jgi:hypothetical protein